MNIFSITGTVKESPVLKETASGIKITQLLIQDKRLSMNRSEYDTYLITCWRSLAEEVANNLEKGMFVGVKGRMQSRQNEKDDQTYYYYELIGEKVSCLSNEC